MEIFWYKLLISLVLTIAIALVLRFRSYLAKHIDFNNFKHFSVAFSLFRILPFWGVYILLNYDATSDVNIFYLSSLSAIKGGLVYRDFQSVYSPFFPYISGLLLLIWNSPKAIVLMMIFVEAGALWATIKWFNKINVTVCTLIYLLLPTTFIFTIFGGQEDVWMCGAFVATLHVYRWKKNEFLFGAGLALGLLVSKLIFILILPGIFFLIKNKIKFISGFAAVFVPIILFLYFKVGLQLLSPIQEANIPRTPNLMSLLRPFISDFVPMGLPILNWLGLLINVFIGLVWISKKRLKFSTEDVFIQLFIITFILLMLLQQSSYTNYALLFLLPLLFFIAESLSYSKWVLFTILNVLLAIHPAFWWRNNLFYITNFADLVNPLFAIEYLFEIFIVFGLLGILKEMYFQNNEQVDMAD